mgnify:CR=1 FL=1
MTTEQAQAQSEPRPSEVRSDALLDAIHEEWHDVRTAPPGMDFHDGWNAALLRVAEIVKASNAQGQP